MAMPTGRSLGEQATGDVDETANILAERARALARPLDPDRTGRDLELLGFEAGGDRLAIPIERTGGLLARVRPTPVPGTPAWVVGAIGLQGRVVAIIRADWLLRGRSSPSDSRAAFDVLIVQDGEDEVGIVVDALPSLGGIRGNLKALPSGSSALVTEVARGTAEGLLVLEPARLIGAIRARLAQSSAPGRAATQPRGSNDEGGVP